MTPIELFAQCLDAYTDNMPWKAAAYQTAVNRLERRMKTGAIDPMAMKELSEWVKSHPDMKGVPVSMVCESCWEMYYHPSGPVKEIRCEWCKE